MARAKKKTKRTPRPRVNTKRRPKAMKHAGPTVEVMADEKADELLAGFFDGSSEFVGVWLPDGEELVSTAEAGERLGVSVGVVNGMIRDGRLESEKLGQVVMVWGSDLDEILQGRT